jgi:hypothetical protein
MYIQHIMEREIEMQKIYNSIFDNRKRQTQSTKVVNMRILYVLNKGQQKECEREFEGSIKANPKMDIVIIIERIFFFAKSILYVLFKSDEEDNNNFFNIFSGGVTVASFAALLFTKALWNLAQIQVLYKAPYLQFDALLDYSLCQQDPGLETMCKMNIAIRSVANITPDHVQKNIEAGAVKADPLPVCVNNIVDAIVTATASIEVKIT